MAYKRKTEDVMMGGRGLPVGIVGVPGLAQYFGVHCATITRYVADGRLPKPFRDLSNRWAWRWEDIHALIEQIKKQSTAA